MFDRSGLDGVQDVLVAVFDRISDPSQVFKIVRAEKIWVDESPERWSVGKGLRKVESTMQCAQAHFEVIEHNPDVHEIGSGVDFDRNRAGSPIFPNGLVIETSQVRE